MSFTRIAGRRRAIVWAASDMEEVEDAALALRQLNRMNHAA